MLITIRCEGNMGYTEIVHDIHVSEEHGHPRPRTITPPWKLTPPLFFKNHQPPHNIS